MFIENQKLKIRSFKLLIFMTLIVVKQICELSHNYYYIIFVTDIKYSNNFNIKEAIK